MYRYTLTLQKAPYLVTTRLIYINFFNPISSIFVEHIPAFIPNVGSFELRSMAKYLDFLQPQLVYSYRNLKLTFVSQKIFKLPPYIVEIPQYSSQFVHCIGKFLKLPLSPHQIVAFYVSVITNPTQERIAGFRFYSKQYSLPTKPR